MKRDDTPYWEADGWTREQWLFNWGMVFALAELMERTGGPCGGHGYKPTMDEQENGWGWR